MIMQNTAKYLKKSNMKYQFDLKGSLVNRMSKPFSIITAVNANICTMKDYQRSVIEDYSNTLNLSHNR